MFGESLRAARDRKIQRELDQKRLAREYMRHCDSNAISSADAMRLAPGDVKAGLSLISSERKKAQRAALHQQKERMANRFKIQGRAS